MLPTGVTERAPWRTRVGYTIVWSGIGLHESSECIPRETITYLFHDRRAIGPTRAYEQRDQLFDHASVEWVMGRYFTSDTVLRDRRRK